MRTRIAVLCLTLGALMVPAAAAQAAPGHDHLTIAATPNPISAGQGVLIYGQLSDRNPGEQTVYLWHRIAPARRFTIISRTTTSSTGFFQFTRAEGVVISNRNWYVTGPARSRSRVIHELVQAQVTLSSSSASNGTITAETGDPISFSGAVFPKHVGQLVMLQDQSSAAGNSWATIAEARTTASSTFSLTKAFARPGTYTLRASFGPDPRNVRSNSDQLTVIVQQRQNPTFTIKTSAPVISDGQSVTISGTLTMPGSTTTPDAGATVILYGRTGGPGHRLRALAQAITGTDGSYSFAQSPANNTVYVVTAPRGRHTARLYQGVADVLSATPSATTTEIGEPIMVTGAVTPDHAGHVIYLQVQNGSGGWSVLSSARVGPNSHYSLAGSFGRAGSYMVRVRITGGPASVGAASAPFTVTVSGLPSPQALPTAG